MNQSLYEYCLRLGDTPLILSQRIGEYCSKAPHLEEDLAITNVGLDLLGQAENFLTYAASLKEELTADELAFKRKEKDFRSFHLVEVPNIDFAFVLVRQFFIDVYHNLFYASLCNSKDETIAGISKKSIKEVRYHLQRSQDWIIRLGQGTEESNHRLQVAINELWMYIDELFYDNEIDNQMTKEGIGVSNREIKNDWFNIVNNTLNDAGLSSPENIPYTLQYGKDGFHTEYMGYLLAEMQHLPLLYPDAKW
ncbi:MAG: phenylacetate-CoA oxygenase subunit PaaI [Crocinitomicaceae bacterium]|nr:MAG: phenylacetate-CoA oxygenase subunit PaaI [Crocinitomicaceae bacterium]